MKPSYDSLSNELKKKNIRLSHRRSKVLEYLCKNPNHPTVDQIYGGLHKVIPTLSKTTIYNTLHILLEAGLIRVITVEDIETRYDIITEPHGHFKCVNCGTIFDFTMNLDLLTAEELNGFKIVDRDMYFKGVCSKCLLLK